MMRALLDLRALREATLGGIGRYASSLAPHLLARRDSCYRFVGAPANGVLAPFADRQVTAELPENDAGASRVLALTCELEDADVLFSVYHPVPTRRACAGVLMVHDLLPLRHPEWFVPRTTAFFDGPLREGAKAATRVLTNSEWTKREVAELYGVSEQRISVVPLAAADVFHRVCDEGGGGDPLSTLASLGVRPPYVLVASTLEPRKNIQGIREAFPLIRQSCDVRLVIVGKYGWHASGLLEPLVHGPFRDDVVVAGQVADERLALLYRHADAFVYPSFAEGFGLPVLEAMAAGAPVVTTRRGALPEVAGGAATYCEPEEPESIAAAVVDVLSNPTKREQLVRCGRERAAAFSWRRTAEHTHEVLASCL